MYDYDSDCGICKEEEDDDDDYYPGFYYCHDDYHNHDDSYNRTNDIKDNNSENKTNNKMTASNVVYHGRDRINPSKFQQQKPGKEKEITGKTKKSKNNQAKVSKQRLAQLEEKN